MDYQTDLDKLEGDTKRLIASRNELRTTAIRSDQEGWAFEFSKVKPETPEKREQAKRYVKWELRVLSDEKYHVVARLSLIYDGESYVGTYRALLEEAIALSAREKPKKGLVKWFTGLWSKERTLKDIENDLKAIKELAQKRVDEEIAKVAK